MKKAVLIVAAVLAAQAVPVAHAAPEQRWNVLLAGGPEANSIAIDLSADGRAYEISSVVPLEVGGNVCAHAEGQPNRLVCAATAISGFEVNAGGGSDAVVVAPAVPVPVTLRGGPGNDRLVGGAGSDKLVGGAGDDVLIGRGGNDSLFGGAGRDRLIGGPGSDLLRGGPGRDLINGGAGANVVPSEPGPDVVVGSHHPRRLAA